ncbi:MAG: MinD/ParA family protein, partial [Actinomycetales bacterium]
MTQDKKNPTERQGSRETAGPADSTETPDAAEMPDTTAVTPAAGDDPSSVSALDAIEPVSSAGPGVAPAAEPAGPADPAAADAVVSGESAAAEEPAAEVAEELAPANAVAKPEEPSVPAQPAPAVLEDLLPAGEEPVYASIRGWNPSGDGDSGAAGNRDGGNQDQHRSARRDREDGPEAASSLTADRLLDKPAAAPVGGWRLWLYKASMGYLNVGDSDRVRIQRAMEHRIAARLGQRTRYVPILSRKGGVGKTTVTTLLGMVLADLREDRVIAMDANPDRGTLSDRSPGRTDYTARQLVKDRFGISSYSQLSTYVARDGSRLDVLASD